MKAVLKNYRQAPRKVRLVADMLRGKRVGEAMTLLTFTPKKASLQMKKLIASATANAKQKGISNADNLVIKEIRVDKGFSFRRFFPRSRGRATPIEKQSSHISITLNEAK